MRRIPIWLVAIVVCAAMATTIAAQTRGALNRKTLTKVAPVYPELAKHMSIGGTVKVEVVIRPNGSVKSTRIVGGNPILIDSAKVAVLKWKFAPSSEETSEVVEVSFESR